MAWVHEPIVSSAKVFGRGLFEPAGLDRASTQNRLVTPEQFDLMVDSGLD